MEVVAFVHQKGGTGKSTLSVAAAMTLAADGARVALVDADAQSTASDWGNRHGHRFGVETHGRVQADLPQFVRRFEGEADWVIIDGPAALNPMTESVLRAATRAIIPARPALPDVWALPWLVALIAKLRREGAALRALLVFTQYQGEPLEPLLHEVGAWRLTVHPHPIPYDPRLAAIFAGEPLPPEMADHMRALLAG